MMRIIAGTLKGKKLLPMRGAATRPTSAKVREALFSIIGGRVEGARVLDLFAGTGAFGLEAISRGAKHAVFIDARKEAVDLIRRNVAACRAEAASTVICWDILRNLNCLKGQAHRFDLVFLDPPYNRDAVLPTLAHLAGSGTLSPEAVIIVEHGPAEAVPDAAAGLAATDRRKYGGTRVTFYGVPDVPDQTE